jgi:Sulfotransferase family
MRNKSEEQERAEAFKRNTRLEALLGQLNTTLQCSEDKLLANPAALGPDFPLVFVMGPLRSGTTLFMQWLADTGLVAYPSNLLARFYGAPLVGAQIQLLLTDPQYNFRNEILDFNHPIAFESENGKTRGALAPNEFWYFWRRFLPFQELDWLPDDTLFRVVDQALLVSELTALTRVFGKPFALKGMILNYNMAFLDALFRKALFVQIRRDPVANVASILDARKRQLGSEQAWYSFKIPEYPQLKNLDPIAQSAGQLHAINRAVTQGMSNVDESRKLVVQYEDFCQRPESIFDQLAAKLGIPDAVYAGPERFDIKRGDIQNRDAIERALADVERAPDRSQA